MNYKMMGRFVAQTLLIEAVFMIPALIISLCYHEPMAVQGYLLTYAVLLPVIGLLFLLCKGAPNALNATGGLVCVAISWIALSALGCLPFVFSGEIPHYVDALFEIVSGFTTTGSSILSNVEALSHGILYWRSFSHWLGGMGVLVFLLAVDPGSKGSGFTMHLLRAESPGPDVGKLVPKMRKTAAILYLIYIVLTVADFLFLVAGGMPAFDAVCTAVGTAGTGGFGIKNDSLASYSPYLQNVTTVFMFLFGVNFSCYYLLLLGQFRSVFRDEELRVYLAVIFVAIAAIVIDLGSFYGSLEETVRHAAFQVATVMSTTGFATTDFDLWPSFSKAILVGLMFMGACAGSTCGGMKVARVVLLLKNLRRNIRQMMRPNTVQVVRSNGRVVDEKVLANTNAYLAAYATILVLSFVVISLDNFSIGTNMTAVIACFNNIGPGLEAVGPTCNFSGFSDLSKLVLIFDMLAGRLEIFPILVLFSKATWKHR